jgi:predicted AlkP superfamily phosphohydrolase/phosphomutase
VTIPRWTVYPALALLVAFLIPAVSRRDDGSGDGRRHPRIVVLGIDGMDPELLAETIERYPGRTPNWTWLIEQGGLHPLATSTPPQSPVAWSDFSTGLDPGGHGIFDFIHREPTTRAPAPSTTRAEPAGHVGLWGDWQFPLGGDSEANRTGKAFWTILQEHGVPADVWRMPANFPVEPSLGWSFSGMMTPAVDSAYGEYKLYTSRLGAASLGRDGKTIAVRAFDGRIDASIPGPPNAFKRGDPAPRATAPLRIDVDTESNAAVIRIDPDGEDSLDAAEQTVVLRPGEWSGFLRVSFELVPHLVHVGGTVRFYLRSLEPDFELYASPVNIDPLDPVTPVSAPDGASAEVAGAVGLYYTQGMPEDVNALKEKAIDDREFLAQADVVHEEGVAMLDYALDRWNANEAGGLAFFYFSGVDLCSHMLWRHHDAEHPAHDAAFAARDTSAWSRRQGSTWKDVVFDLYLRMDAVLGRVRERMPEDALLVVMSDHGFAPYRRKFSLNTWLLEQGYLVLKEGREREKPARDPAFAPVVLYNVALADGGSIEGAVDWTRTRAYGVGFNGLYLNLAGRERDDPATAHDESGVVRRGAEAEALLDEISSKLEALRDEGRRVVVRCDRAAKVYSGPRVAEAPDLVVGYDALYGNSDPASTGRIPNLVFEDNTGGTFNGSHLMAPEVVPGVLMTNGEVLEGEHGLRDLAVELLRRYGVGPQPGMRGRPVLR